MTQKLNVGMVSLGCDKNRVDAETMLGILNHRGYNIVNDERLADVLIVNTCGFIESAKQESIDAILDLAKYKEEGRCKVLIASGCLAERYSDELLSEIPELDGVVGVGNYLEIDNIICDILKSTQRVNRTNNIDYDVNFNEERVLTTPGYTAYIKIAEGCNNNCSYCIIPKLRGIYRSRSMDNILKEARYLAGKGVKEIILVAQDTTKYGMDLYGKKKLAELLKNISIIDGIEWIRLLYCYPEDIDDELIEEIAANPKVCKYLDIPIQHVSDEVLANMRRLSNRSCIENLIKKLRQRIPGIVIRTTLIVGFPGETEEQFRELYDFLKEYKLDRVGVFTYSQEEQTDAALLPNQIDNKVKKARFRELMTLQKRISRENNDKKVGSIFRVLVESVGDDGILWGRTYGDAPEIDGGIYIKNSGANIKPGDFVEVLVTGSHDYDLVGEVLL